MDTDRWLDAQEAEAGHEYHSDVRSEEDTKKIVERFGATYDSLRNESILAVGAGTGIIHGMRVGERRVAIDPLSSDIFDTCHESAAQVVTGMGEHLPFVSDMFDLVIHINVLDHTANPEATLSEIHRVLKPDGRMFFHLNVFGTPKFINQHLSKVDSPHPHHYTAGEITSLLSSSGYDVELKREWKPETDGKNMKYQVATRIFGMRKVDIVASIR